MLSVILPNYNHAKYLPESLGSYLSQTRPPDELIIIDDCSSDDSVAVISRLIEGYPYARLLRNPENKGALVTVRRGFEEARGDLLMVAPADDIAAPRLFEVAVGLLEAHPEAAFFSSASAIIDEHGALLPAPAVPVPLPAPGYIDPAHAARALMRDDSWFMGNTGVYRRSHLEAAGGIPVELGAFNDGYLMCYLALKHGACFSPEALGSWRVLRGSMSWTANSNIEATADLVEKVMVRMADHPEVFPAGYPRCWRSRRLFSAYSFNAGRHFPGDGLPARLLRMLYKLGLFAAMRPGDILPSVVRHLSHRLR